MRLAISGMTCLAVLAGTGSAAAQDRADLIQQARFEPDPATRAALFAQAANPVDRDSLWAVGVYEIAQIMRDLGQDDVAGTWMRWAGRHGDWAIDPGYFVPSLVTFYNEQVAGLVDDPDPDVGVASTSWEWPDGFNETDPGTLAVAVTDAAVPLTVRIEGQNEPLGNTGSAELPAGTYELVASAEGYDTVRVEREVLPGVGTVVTFEMLPVLPDEVAEQVGASVVRLQRMAAGVPVCTNAVTMSQDLAVTSMSALDGATTVEVPRPGGPTLGGQVVQSDPATDLAVVRIPQLGGSALPTTSLAEQAFGWSLFAPECIGPLDVLRSRLAGQQMQDFAGDALGAPLVDRSGALLGLVGVSGRIASAEDISGIVDAASAQFAEGGGFPVRWLVIGAAVVGGGVAALLLAGGDESPSTPSTGSITITLPSG